MYDAVMKVDKLSISFPPDLGDGVRAAAARQGVPVSSWLAEAAAAKLRSQSLGEFLDEWEAEHGAFSEEELAQAAADLQLPWPPASESQR